MARERNPERDKARRIWLDSGGTLTARQVAEQVGAKPEQVRKWKSLDSWAAELEAQKPPRKRGGQPGNKNAAGAGAPHGKGGVSNPVERVVLNIPQSVSDTIANMRRENERLTAIKGEILSELNALNYREKAVIYGFYIDGLQWERLSQRVNYSPRQCRNIRNIALDRLAKRFEQNKQISRYVFPEK